MFINSLKNKLVSYDRFGEHWVNGLKAVFILEILFLINMIYSIHTPYFYYFYIPLTAFAAEIAGNTLKDKFTLYFYTLLGSTISVFLFGMFSPYRTFFVFFVFFYAILIYLVAIYKLKNMFVPAPIILSLASYSLNYGSSDSNFYIAINHAMQTLLATSLVMSALLFFPRLYYLWIWRNGFYDVLTRIEELTGKITNGIEVEVPIIPGTIVMDRYSRMLSRRMKVFSILKITLLTLDLVMAVSYLVSFQKQLRAPYIAFLHRYVLLLKESCKLKRPLMIKANEEVIFRETHELRTLHAIILSWNYLCLNK